MMLPDHNLKTVLSQCTTRTCWMRVAGTALLAAVVMAPALRAGSATTGLSGGTGTAGGVTSSGGFSAGGGDETVGTLPIIGTRIDFVRHARLDGPSLALEGRLSDIMASLVSIRGSTTVRLEALPSGRVRAVFVGDVRVAFSATSFIRAGVVAGVVHPNGALEALPLALYSLQEGVVAASQAGGHTVAAARVAELIVLQRSR
jgi:hypothetical protein